MTLTILAKFYILSFGFKTFGVSGMLQKNQCLGNFGSYWIRIKLDHMLEKFRLMDHLGVTAGQNILSKITIFFINNVMNTLSLFNESNLIKIKFLLKIIFHN